MQGRTILELLKRRWRNNLLGCVLFFTGTGILIWNEGKARGDNQSLDEASRAIISVNPYEEPLSDNDGCLVHICGTLLIEKPLTLPEYGIAVEAVKLKMDIKLYPQNVKKYKGAHTDSPSLKYDKYSPDVFYFYTTDWQYRLADRLTFYDPNAFQSPFEMVLRSIINVSPLVKVGHFILGSELKEKFTNFVEISDHNLQLKRHSTDYFGTYYQFSNVKLSQMRAHFYCAGISGEPVTIIAMQKNGILLPFITKKGAKILLLRLGIISPKEIFIKERYDADFKMWRIRATAILLIYISFVCFGRLSRIFESNSKYSLYLEHLKKAQESYKPCDRAGCNCYHDVIKSDLKPFNSKITKEMVDNVRNKGTKYQIIDGRLYRDKECMFPARCSGIEYFLLKLVEHLPNSEFIINTRDWPQIYKDYGVFGPVFSFSKTSNNYDIMYPAWAFWEGGPAIALYPSGIGKWDTHRRLISKVANETKWEDKLPAAFFRGSRTSSERDALVLLSRQYPDLVDAQYTKNQAWKSDADTLHAPPATEVHFTEHCKYKYLFNFRGVAASFRLKHILLCKSLVFHVGDEWVEFFYLALKPWVHYIPVKPNANQNELKELLEFVRSNDEVVKDIAERGFNFIWENLTTNHVLCYWKKLLLTYTNSLQYEPKLEKDLVEITPK